MPKEVEGEESLFEEWQDDRGFSYHKNAAHGAFKGAKWSNIILMFILVAVLPMMMLQMRFLVEKATAFTFSYTCHILAGDLCHRQDIHS